MIDTKIRGCFFAKDPGMWIQEIDGKIRLYGEQELSSLVSPGDQAMPFGESLTVKTLGLRSLTDKT